MNTEQKVEWKLIGHSHQIADTGDYDGYWEITDGKFSIYSKDDFEEGLQAVVDSLNNSGCKLYGEDYSGEIGFVYARIKELETENEDIKANPSKYGLMKIPEGGELRPKWLDQGQASPL